MRSAQERRECPAPYVRIEPVILPPVPQEKGGFYNGRFVKELS
jgi:hypothetical protein